MLKKPGNEMKSLKRVNAKRKPREKTVVAETVGATGGTAGGLGAGFAACHASCQSLIALLAFFGVTILGMPLAFLEPYSLPLLVVGLALMAYSFYVFKKHGMPLRGLLKPVATGFAVALALIALLFVFNMQTSTSTPAGAQSGASVNASVSDKCAIQPGYTQESWREHLSHHPDLYKECLQPSAG